MLRTSLIGGALSLLLGGCFYPLGLDDKTWSALSPQERLDASRSQAELDAAAARLRAATRQADAEIQRLANEVEALRSSGVAGFPSVPASAPALVPVVAPVPAAVVNQNIVVIDGGGPAGRKPDLRDTKDRWNDRDRRDGGNRPDRHDANGRPDFRKDEPDRKDRKDSRDERAKLGSSPGHVVPGPSPRLGLRPDSRPGAAERENAERRSPVVDRPSAPRVAAEPSAKPAIAPAASSPVKAAPVPAPAPQAKPASVPPAASPPVKAAPMPAPAPQAKPASVSPVASAPAPKPGQGGSGGDSRSDRSEVRR